MWESESIAPPSLKLGTLCMQVVSLPADRVAESGVRAPVKIFRDAQKNGPAKNLYTKSKSLTLICRVTWGWYERLVQSKHIDTT
jgi:hypothetical protein